MEKKVQQAIDKRIFPCAEILLAEGEEIIFHQAFGNENHADASTYLKKGALFDLASLTKPLATTFAILHLLDKGKLSLNTLLPDIFQG
ncbi:MAG: serine hydrolase, partial [Proteobacteria bacterium]|nr:serine hydrolase [Pseudomonadota bacterium]